MLPLWQAQSGLPLAMQFVGGPGDEETLYSLAGELEQALPAAGVPCVGACACAPDAADLPQSLMPKI